MDKLPFEALEQMLAEAKQKVPIGSRWRHYKGNDYTINLLVITEEDNQVAVVYTPLKHPETTFVRPLSVWLESVEWNGDMVQRFSKID